MPVSILIFLRRDLDILHIPLVSQPIIQVRGFLNEIPLRNFIPRRDDLPVVNLFVDPIRRAADGVLGIRVALDIEPRVVVEACTQLQSLL